MNPRKTDLRSAVRQRKQAMSKEDISVRSSTLCSQVLQTEVYHLSKTIYGYLPFNQEVDLLPLLQKALDDGKQVALPKCFGKEMRFILVSDISRIQYSRFGAPEPMDDGPVARDESALVIVPGLGGFVCNKASARIDKKSGKFTPPSVEVLFNQRLQHNDGLLQSALVETEGLSANDAEQLIKEEVARVMSALAKEHKFDLSGLGVLEKDGRNIIFHSQP